MIELMLGTLIQVAGVWFLVAVALDALAVLAEQWGAVRSPEEDSPKHGGLALMGFALSVVTPGLLLAHAFLSTHAVDPNIRVLALGLPIAALLVGALSGAILGAGVKAAAPVMRKLALPLGFVAFAVAIYAAAATIQVLIQAAQNGGVIYVTP